MNEVGSKGLLKESEWLSSMGVQTDFSFFLSFFLDSLEIGLMFTFLAIQLLIGANYVDKLCGIVEGGGRKLNR